MGQSLSSQHINRTSAHYRALKRNLAMALFAWSPTAIETKAKEGKKLIGKEYRHYGKPYQIRTTAAKAKAVRPLVEKLITLSKKGTLHHRRQAITLLGSTLTAKRTVKHIFNELAKNFTKRQGGYTRIVKLPVQIRQVRRENEVGGGIKRNRYYGTRLGDNARLVLLELVEFDNQEYQPAGILVQEQAARAEQEAAQKSAEKQAAQ